MPPLQGQRIVTTILQKPLVGMNIKSVDEPVELKLKEEVPDTEEETQLSQAD